MENGVVKQNAYKNLPGSYEVAISNVSHVHNIKHMAKSVKCSIMLTTTIYIGIIKEHCKTWQESKSAKQQILTIHI